MCIYVCVCVYVHMYLCVSVCMYARVCLCVYTHSHYFPKENYNVGLLKSYSTSFSRFPPLSPSPPLYLMLVMTH